MLLVHSAVLYTIAETSPIKVKLEWLELKSHTYSTFLDHIVGDRPEAENIVLLVTDGVSNVNKGLAELEAEKARNEGITFLTVGIDLPTDRELKQIANNRNDIWLVSDFSELDSISEPVSKAACGTKQ